MKIVIDGVRLDTEKAKRHWVLRRVNDDGNRINGDLYLSSKGTWYAETPSQWANRHRWEIVSADAVLADYAEYLTQEEIAEISDLTGATWE